MNSGLRLWLAIFTGIPLVFVVVGAWLAWDQDRRMTGCLSTTGTVVSSDVGSSTSTDSDGHRSTVYRPYVSYTYTVGGKEYKGAGVTVLDVGAGSGWAEGIAAKYQPGKTTTVFYDPKDPSKAFLVREYDFFPYMFILFPALFFFIGGAVAISQRGVKKEDGAAEGAGPSAGAGERGWFELRRQGGVMQRKRLLIGLSIGWFVYGGLVIGHYATRTTGWTGEAMVASVVFAVIGLVPLGLGVWAWSVARTFGDARVWVDREGMWPLGAAVKMKMVQTVWRGVLIDALTASLVCRETYVTRSGGKTSHSSRERSRQSVEISRALLASPGHEVRGEAAFAVPQDGPPTNGSEYPKAEWFVEVRAAVKGAADYVGRFGVRVG